MNYIIKHKIKKWIYYKALLKNELKIIYQSLASASTFSNLIGFLFFRTLCFKLSRKVFSIFAFYSSYSFIAISFLVRRLYKRICAELSNTYSLVISVHSSLWNYIQDLPDSSVSEFFKTMALYSSSSSVSFFGWSINPCS